MAWAPTRRVARASALLCRLEAAWRVTEAMVFMMDIMNMMTMVLMTVMVTTCSRSPGDPTLPELRGSKAVVRPSSTCSQLVTLGNK